MGSEYLRPGYVADLIECQSALVVALNTTINRLAELGDHDSARRAVAERDAALNLTGKDD